MKQIVTTGIILHRTNFAEADRILTLLSADYGKLRLIAHGVRRSNSKLAGGIELFSLCAVTYIEGRGEIGTLISSRLVKHYGHIVEDIDRTMLGYEFMKQLNHLTEDASDRSWFELLEQTLVALNDQTTNMEIVRFWFSVKLLDLSGHMVNLTTNVDGGQLSALSRYKFDFDHMGFVEQGDGPYTADHIKVLRLAVKARLPNMLQRVSALHEFLPVLESFTRTMLQMYLPSQ